MAAALHGSSIKHGSKIIGQRQQHKGQEGRNNTAGEAATTVSKSVFE
jgi:hypothetical protein